MKDHVFADGIGAISVIGGTVRLDFFTFSPTEKDPNGQPKAVPQHRLVMTVPAFMHAANKIQEAVTAIGRVSGTPSRSSEAPVEAVSAPIQPPKVPFP